MDTDTSTWPSTGGGPVLVEDAEDDLTTYDIKQWSQPSLPFNTPNKDDQ